MFASKNFEKRTEFSEKGSSNDDEIPIFKNLYISAFSKALKIRDDLSDGTSKLIDSKSIKRDNNNKSNVSKKRSSISKESDLSHNVENNHVSSTADKNTLKPKKSESLQNYSDDSNNSLDTSFSPTKLLYECDMQRRLNWESAVKERIKKMSDTDKLIHDSLEHLKQTRLEELITKRMLSEQKILDDIHEQEIRNRPKREAHLANENLKNAQRLQERNQKVREAEEEAKKKSEAILLKRRQLDKILEWQKEYGKEYKEMLDTIKSCKDKYALSEITNSQSKILKSCAEGCENLIKKCKRGDVSEIDVEFASKLVETVKHVHQYFATEINRVNEALAEAQKKDEIQNNKREIERAKANVNEESVERNFDPNDLSDCFDPQSHKIYVMLRTYLCSFEKSYQKLMEDDATKKFRFNCQKAVTIPVNAISPVSGAHLSDKYIKLHNLLSGKIVEVGDVRVSASQHPLGIPYCKNVLARKFVRQGDSIVSSKPDAAFSIAAVLASLWVDFPDFGQLVLAHFQLECPYLAPVFMPQVDGQSDESYYKSLGYHYSPNGEVEKQDSFLKRMSGIMRLYAALIISKVKQPGKPNPLGLSEGWRWMSAILNLEPRPDICATLLYNFLEVAGSEMFRVYGGQFKKMLAYICQEYFPKLEKVTPASSGGPLVRLEGFLQKLLKGLKEGKIPKPDGMLPENFW